MKIIYDLKTNITIYSSNFHDKWDRGTSQSFVSIEFFPYSEDYYIGSRLEKDVDFEVSPGQEVYAVLVQYDDGDTFGRDEGQIEVLEIFDNIKDAEELQKLVFEPSQVENYYVKNWQIKYKGKTYYKAWIGYFKKFVDCWIEESIVQCR